MHVILIEVSWSLQVCIHHIHVQLLYWNPRGWINNTCTQTTSHPGADKTQSTFQQGIRDQLFFATYVPKMSYQLLPSEGKVAITQILTHPGINLRSIFCLHLSSWHQWVHMNWTMLCTYMDTWCANLCFPCTYICWACAYTCNVLCNLLPCAQVGSEAAMISYNNIYGDL